jgi:hypothetical protein
VNIPLLLAKETSVASSERSKRPRPPSALGIQIVFQATKAVVPLLTSPVYRKFLQILMILLITISGMGKIFSQK